MFKIGKNINIMYFNSDDDFYEFCVKPGLIPIEYTDKSGNKKVYSDFEFTEEYKKALNEGKRFVIKDENSLIYKRGAVSYRTITKVVENLDPYFSFKKKNKIK